jgi:hypothetical protein
MLSSETSFDVEAGAAGNDRRFDDDGKVKRIAPALVANAWTGSRFRMSDYDSPLRLVTRRLPEPVPALAGIN